MEAGCRNHQSRVSGRSANLDHLCEVRPQRRKTSSWSSAYRAGAPLLASNLATQKTVSSLEASLPISMIPCETYASCLVTSVPVLSLATSFPVSNVAVPFAVSRSLEAPFAVPSLEAPFPNCAGRSCGSTDVPWESKRVHQLALAFSRLMCAARDLRTRRSRGLCLAADRSSSAASETCLFTSDAKPHIGRAITKIQRAPGQSQGFVKYGALSCTDNQASWKSVENTARCDLGIGPPIVPQRMPPEPVRSSVKEEKTVLSHCICECVPEWKANVSPLDPVIRPRSPRFPVSRPSPPPLKEFPDYWKDKCWCCNKFGHKFSECTQPFGLRRRCFGCGMFDRTKATCSNCSEKYEVDVVRFIRSRK